MLIVPLHSNGNPKTLCLQQTFRCQFEPTPATDRVELDFLLASCGTALLAVMFAEVSTKLGVSIFLFPYLRPERTIADPQSAPNKNAHMSI